MTTQRLDALIQAHLDGALSPTDRAELEQALLAAPAARARFWSGTALHGQLHEAAQRKWMSPPAPHAMRRRWWGIIGLAAAAALALLLRPATPPATPAAHGPAWVAEWRGPVLIERDGSTRSVETGRAIEPGEALWVGTGGWAQVEYADRTRLTLAERTAVAFRGSNLLELALQAGRLEADVHPQPAGRQLVLQTPLARATVHGTVFSLSAGARSTELRVQRGLVRLAHAQRDSEVDVAAGEYAVAVPGAELLAGLEPVARGSAHAATASGRDPARQPFSSDSPWNTAVDPRASFEPVHSAAFDFARHGAVVLPAARDRALFIAAAGDPETDVLNRYTGEQLAHIRAPAAALRDVSRPMSATFIDPETGMAHELALAGRDGASLVAMVYRAIELRGAGIPPEQSGHTFGGFPLLAGLIRAGELEGGIHHALAASALHTGLSRGPDDAAHVWPSHHLPLENKLVAMMGAEGNVRYGTRLAIPRTVDLATLGVGTNGPAFALARALQEYGAYITHSYGPVAPGSAGGWVQPDLQFFAESDDLPALRTLSDAAARLAPHLQVVADQADVAPR